MVKNMRGYKFCLLKAYFEKGYGLTSYIKYMIAFFGLASSDVNKTLIIAVIYGLSCFVVGWIWYKSKYVFAEAEVANQFNLFQREMRKSISYQKGKSLNSRIDYKKQGVLKK